jgi:hypothetical protein
MSVFGIVGGLICIVASGTVTKQYNSRVGESAA